MDAAVAALDPSYRPSRTSVVEDGERVYERQEGGARVTVRLQALSSVATRAVVNAHASTRSPSLGVRSPFREGVDGVGIVPLPGWGDCPPDDTITDPEDRPRDVGLNPGDTEPVMIGGMSALSAELRYPPGARRANQHGSVFVTFILERDGSIGCASVFRGSWDLLNTEALRVVRTRRFTPGMMNGAPVRVRYTLPIRFALR